MTGPTDEQRRRVRKKIAEVLRWTELGDNGHGLFGTPPDAKLNQFVPDWPGSLDTARKLEITNWGRFVHFLDLVARATTTNDDRTAVIDMLRATPDQWCLAYLESEHGWRWTECERCATHSVNSIGIAKSPIGDITPCPACDGEKGRWVKC